MRTRALLATICLTIPLFAGTGTAETKKIGMVMECESISKLMTDISGISKALGMKIDKSRIEATLEGMSASASLTGISSNKPVRMYFVMEPDTKDSAQPAPGNQGKPLVLVLPLTDSGDAYLKSVGSSYGKTEKVRALSHFSMPAEEGTRKEADFYVGITGNQAVAGTDAAKVEFVLTSLYTSDSWNAALSSLPGTLKISMDVNTITPALEEAIKSISQMTKQLSDAPANQQLPMAYPGQVLTAEGGLLLAIMKQLKTWSLGIGVNDNAVEINSLMSPAADSQLAAITRTLVPPSGKYACALPADAFIAASGNGMNICDIFIEPYCAMMETIFDTPNADSAKFKTNMRNTMTVMKGAFSGEYAIGVVPGASAKDMAIVEIVGVNDPARFRKSMMDALTSMKDFYASSMPLMSITFEKTRTSEGVEVIPYTCSYNPPADSPQQAAPLMNLGKNYRAEMACMDNAFIYTMGGGPAVMDSVVARMKAGGSRTETPKTFARLFPAPPEKMISTYTLELGRLVKFFISSIPNGDQLLQMIPDSKSGVAGYTVLKGSDILAVNRIGFEEIECIRSSLMPLGLMMMTSAGPGASAQGSPARGTPESKCIRNLRMLGDAKEQCALEKSLKDGDAIDPSVLTQYLLRGKMPVCPDGGTYTVNPVGRNPNCSVATHKLKD